MSSITTDQGIVHYEVFGRGRPVILLHGWLGSWGVWQETMTQLGRSYRTYALDFWGFGESGKKRDTYAIQDFVSLVDQFMEQLGIVRAPLVGHSMGGTVSLSFAIQHPERVSKVTVIGSPIIGSSLAILLKLRLRSQASCRSLPASSSRWARMIRPIAFLVHRMMWTLKTGIRIFSPLVTRDKRWPDMMDRDLSYTTLDSFLQSIASLRRTDLRPYLHQLKIPTMGIYGHKDIIVDPDQWKPLLEGVPHSRIERIKESGHFPMLDVPQQFMETLTDFLDSEPSE